MTALFHFTCQHAADRIEGLLLPHPQPLIGDTALVWLTDLDEPDREGLGLTSMTLACDRTQIRYRVTDPTPVEPWIGSTTQASVAPPIQALLHRYSRPEHWFISRQPVAVDAGT